MSRAFKETYGRIQRAPIPIQRPPQLGVEPLGAPRPAPTAPPPPAPPPAAVQPAPAPRPSAAPAQQPALAMRLQGDRWQVQLKWTDAEAYARDYRIYLKGDGVYLPVVDPPHLRERGRRLDLYLVLPTGARLTCPGEVVAPIDQGVGVALRLTPEQRALLAAAAEAR